jgi:hypothetical protein
MGNRRGAYRFLMGRSEGNISLGRPRCRWEGNIKIDIRGMGWRAWTGLLWLWIGTGGGRLRIVVEVEGSTLEEEE